MANSTGIDRQSGAVLTDWRHVTQSIEVVLTTAIGSRVMRRAFGSEIFDMVDARLVARNVLAVYSVAASALLRHEPRFRLTSASITRADGKGRVGLDLFGTYYPRGHRGDFSIAESASARVVFAGDAP